MSTRRYDPATSHEAEASIADRITLIQQDVLAYARSVPEFIDLDLAAHFTGTYGPSTVRTRRIELVRLGLIQQVEWMPDTPKYRTMPPSNRRHIVWRATPTKETTP
jgi:hypothetical protein